MHTSVEATNELQLLLTTWKREFVESSDSIYQRNYQGPTDADLSSDSERITTLTRLCSNGAADLQYLEKERGFVLIPHVFWSKELILFFLNIGMNVNSKDENGDTALHLLIRHGHIDNTFMYNKWYLFQHIPHLKRRYPNFNPVKLVEFLLEKSADPQVPNFFQENSLLTLTKAVEDRLQVTRNVADMLMKKGADVNTLNSDCESVLHIADRRKYGDDLFINEQFSGNVDARSSKWLYSKTPLMIAASSNNLKRCKLLVDSGANIHVKDLQGYTALHHARLNGAKECGDFLEIKGADPEEKSASGKDSYMLGVYGEDWSQGSCDFFNAPPEKQAQILEIGGALNMMYCLEWKQGIEIWKKAKNICQNFNLQLSEEFSANFEFLVQNQNNATANGDIYRAALNTVVRLTDGNSSKFWYLLRFAHFGEEDITGRGRMYSFENLDKLWQDELQRVEDFVSLEENDFNTLSSLVEGFYNWLKSLCFSKSLDQATPIRISQLQAISNLAIACYRKLISATNGNKMSKTVTDLYINLCLTLTLILHPQFEEIISKTAFNDSERLFNDIEHLLHTLISLDLRDKWGNSLLHLILERRRSLERFSTVVSIVLIKFNFEDIKTKNIMGFEPAQYINWVRWLKIIKDNPKFVNLMTESIMVPLAQRGAHLDARNAFGGWTLREALLQDQFNVQEDLKYLAFHHDSLQCACARVLVRSLVPYRSLGKQNLVPKIIVDFIDSHLQY